ERLDLVPGDEGGRGGEVPLHELALGRDDDLLALEDLLLERDVRRGRDIDADTDAFDAGGAVADEGEDEGVGVRADADDSVAPVEVGGGALRGALDEDVDAGERFAGGGVGDGALDLAVLSGSASAQEHGEGEGGEEPRRSSGRAGGCVRAGHRSGTGCARRPRVRRSEEGGGGRERRTSRAR